MRSLHWPLKELALLGHALEGFPNRFDGYMNSLSSAGSRRTSGMITALVFSLVRLRVRLDEDALVVKLVESCLPVERQPQTGNGFDGGLTFHD